MALDTKIFINRLIDNGYSHLCIVPCSFAKNVINEAINNPDIEYIPSASEAVAVSKGTCPPGIPLQGSKSNKKLMVILAGILGIGLGLVYAFVREFAANSEKEEKDKMSEAKSLILKNISELMNGRLK